MSQQTVRKWGPYDSALWQTSAVIGAIRACRLDELVPVAVPFGKRRGCVEERIYGVGAVTLSAWGSPGDGTYEHSGGLFVAGGGSGLALTAAAAGIQAARNAARRRRAIALAQPRWLPIDQGLIYVGTHGFHVQTPSTFHSWDWRSIHSAQLVEMAKVWIQGQSTNAAISWRLDSHWAELIFVLWAMAENPEHPQLTSGSWMPPAWAPWAASQGYGPLPHLRASDGSGIGSDGSWHAVADAVPQSPPGVGLLDAMRIHASVKQAFAAYECSHEAVLAWPALSDTHEPATGLFVDAFAEANSLEPENVDRCPLQHAQKYIAAVLRAERAWEAADANAREVALSRMDAGQRRKVRQAKLALDTALNPATPASLRDVAVRRARALLDGLVRLPSPFTAKLDRAVSATANRPEIALAAGQTGNGSRPNGTGTG